MRYSRTGRYDVVLLDPEYKAHGGDSNSEQEKKALMSVLDGWRTAAPLQRFLFAPTAQTAARHEVLHPRHLRVHLLPRGAEVVLGLQRVEDGYSAHSTSSRTATEAYRSDAPWGLLFDPEDGYRRDPKDDEEPRHLEHDVPSLPRGAPRPVAHRPRHRPQGARRAASAPTANKVRDILERGAFTGELEYERMVHAGRNATAECYRLSEVARRSEPPEPPGAAQGSLEAGGSGAAWLYRARPTGAT